MEGQPLIRRGRVTDLPAVFLGELDYIRQIEPQQEARWKAAISQHVKQWTSALESMLVAELAGQIVGYCFWENHGDQAVLASLYVAPSHRRRGIGQELLARFVAEAKERHLISATLGVQSENPARLLYEKAGFIRTHYTDGFLHYRLALTPG
ncbi:N-acetyltransferase family protein [Hyphomicrobium sp.]|jgi:ribosomal protein S18 acetylase RimI-like enzyme|uniref:GNAT family N-acetyltransferase n=1 Tax=Hyphomicrobium sp. TaxID=82 RepID=UPI0035681632